MAISAVQSDLQLLESAVLQHYLHIDGPQRDSEKLAQEIQKTQDHLTSLLAKYRDISQLSAKDLSLDSDWISKALKPNYPEVAALFSHSSDGVTSFTLRTVRAPFVFVYNGTHPFYITDPCYSYTMAFGANGYLQIKNQSQGISVNAKGTKAGFTIDTEDSGPQRYLVATSHPHASSDRPGDTFSGICTGSGNPFRDYLTRDLVKTMGDFTRGTRLALDWLRTYNVNDAYGGYTPWRPIRRSHPFKWEHSLSRWRADAEISEDDFNNILVTLISECYAFLKKPLDGTPKTFGDLWSSSTIRAWEDLELFTSIEVPSPEGAGRCSPIFFGLQHLAAWMRQGSIASSTSMSEFTVHHLFRDMDFMDKLKMEADPAIRLGKQLFTWLSVLEAFKALYAAILFLACTKEEVRIIGWDHIEGLLLRDMVAFPLNKQGDCGYNIGYLDQYLWKSRLEINNTVEPCQIMREYLDCIPNLAEVLPTRAKAENRVVGKMLKNLL